MTLRFSILGYEVARIELDLGDYNEPIYDNDPPRIRAQRELTPLDKGIKSVTKFWVRHMNR